MTMIDPAARAERLSQIQTLLGATQGRDTDDNFRAELIAEKEQMAASNAEMRDALLEEWAELTASEHKDGNDDEDQDDGKLTEQGQLYAMLSGHAEGLDLGWRSSPDGPDLGDQIRDIAGSVASFVGQCALARWQGVRAEPPF